MVLPSGLLTEATGAMQIGERMALRGLIGIALAVTAIVN